MTKDTFVLRTSYAPIFSTLTDAQAGSLIKSIFAYVHQEPCAKLTDPALHMAWRFIKQDIDYDTEKYARVCAQRKAVALARWESLKQTGKRSKKRSAAR